MTTKADEPRLPDIADPGIAQRCRDAGERWLAFWYGLTWQAISTYDKGGGEVVMLRAGNRWSCGRWSAGGATSGGAMWRHVQNHRAGQPLEFEPEHFAIIQDAWHDLLSVDGSAAPLIPLAIRR